ncbi:uncharacterized protein LOC114722460 [Neltuma alba]|uniref:uncharacterized protein LOC114722460 n=1 Tax=Neltuma alba TaxID=207710 RepID=UPI0010A4A56C|nr:uncharacterized protein LOC114722460 [Prosopis alba]
MIMKERDEELVLFLEMRRREKENQRNTFLLLPNSENDVVDASHFEFGRGISSAVSSENDMSDYDWLLPPPSTPLFPTLEKEPRISAKGETEISKARTTALKPRETNIISEQPSRRIIASKTHRVMPSLNSSTNGNTNRRPSSPFRSISSTLSSTTKSSKATLTSAKPVRSSTPIRSSSASKMCPALARNPAKSQGSLLDAPPKLKASLPERPASASRYGRLSSLGDKDSNSNGRPKRPILRSRSGSINDGENDSPDMIGTKMVERIVNMRKLVRPKLDAGHHSAEHNTSGKSDRSGFGRSLSNKSLDMAMRHMDIRSIQGSLKPHV